MAWNVVPQVIHFTIVYVLHLGVLMIPHALKSFRILIHRQQKGNRQLPAFSVPIENNRVTGIIPTMHHWHQVPAPVFLTNKDCQFITITSDRL